MNAAAILIGLGLALAALGLGGLFWCIRLARRIRAGTVPDAELKGAFVKLSVVNMAAMGGAMIGLAMALVGFIIQT